MTKPDNFRGAQVFAFVALALVVLLGCLGCSNSNNGDSAQSTSNTLSSEDALDASLVIDNESWNYDEANDVYWQVGLAYCTNPQATEYESMGVYVPGAYFDGKANGDGTYTCTVNAAGEVAGYSADTAPIVIPVNTPGYSAQMAPTTFSSNRVSEYLNAGYVYVEPGCRGRDNGQNPDGTTYDGGAPWGVTDLKAAIRTLRYNADTLPGDTDRIYTFGMSGGGAQSVIVGATGNSELYTPYLEAIGAPMTDANGNAIGDEIYGVMGWCPITSLPEADAAYEWMMGQYSTTGTRADGIWTAALSDDLAVEFADYVNGLGLVDEDGTPLTLTESTEGIFAAGSYYDYLLDVIETSLNNFLADTTFPYTPSASGKGIGGIPNGDLEGAPNGTPPDGATPPDDLQSGNGTSPKLGDLSDSERLSGPPSRSGKQESNNASGQTPGVRQGLPEDSSTTNGTTYATAQDYIDSLNSDGAWIEYDAATNTAKITSIAAFVEHMKSATKDVGAFDDLNRSQAENKVFGTGDDDALHFDAIIAALLTENAEKYAAAGDYDAALAEEYVADREAVDALGVSSDVRQNMYNPLYFLLNCFEGYGTTDVAKVWRINTGISQGDTSLTTEVNLELALNQNPNVDTVDFTTVWAQGHTEAERAGTSSTNFISWVKETAAK